MKNLLIIFVLATTSISFSQNLNEYKYAQVPSKFNVFKEKDQYRLNTLARLYMQKFGFETYFDTDISTTDFASNNCNKVYVDVLESNSLFQTKITILLKDCKNNILFTSKQGKSREKEYKVSYTEAFREAFESLVVLNHKYVEKKAIEKNQDSSAEIIVQENNSLLQTKITILLKDCKNNILFTSKQGTSREKEYKVSYTEAFRKAFESLEILNHKYVEKKAIENVQESKTDAIVPDKSQENNIAIIGSELLSSNVLIAEKIENGFLIINSKTSTIVLKLYKTSESSVYIANSNKINGVVLKKGQDFFIEYYKDKKLFSEKLNVSGL